MTGRATVQLESSLAAPDCPGCGTTRWRFLFHRQGYDFVECTKCKLMRLDPIPTPEALTAHYEKRARAGNYELGRAGERTATLEGVFDFVLKHKPLPSNKAPRMFDAGCFDGGLLDIAKSHGWETWGLELQGEAADAAKEKHPGRIFEGFVEDYSPQEEETFDVFTAIGVIEHLLNPKRLVEIAAASLKPGGTLILQTPNRASLPSRLMAKFWPCIAAPEHTHYFSHKNLRLLLASAGFDSFTWNSHWKPLRLGYAADQFKNFGPEIYNLIAPFIRITPEPILNLQLKLYGGEMLVAARKKHENRA